MSLQRYQYHPMSLLSSFLDDDLFSSLPVSRLVNHSTCLSNLKPFSDLRETDDSYEVTLAMPGVPKDKIQMEIKDVRGVPHLVISSEHSEESENEEEHWSKVMRCSYHETLRLPVGVKDENVSADHKDGVLHVTVKKPKPEPNEPRKISIN